jgi:hypothetical protein
MPATSHARGHSIWLDGSSWRYADDNAPVAKCDRACARCGETPTAEGYDACLGFIAGATSACCGHGVHAPFSSIEASDRDARSVTKRRGNEGG